MLYVPTSLSLNVSTTIVILSTNILIFLTKRQVELYIFCVQADPSTFFVDRFVHSSRLYRCCFCRYELRMRTSNCRKSYSLIGIERSFSSTPEQIRRTRSRRKMTFGRWWKTYQTKKSEFLSFHRLLLHDSRVSYRSFRSLAKLCCNSVLEIQLRGIVLLQSFPKMVEQKWSDVVPKQRDASFNSFSRESLSHTDNSSLNESLDFSLFRSIIFRFLDVSTSTSSLIQGSSLARSFTER